jgi:hypothetical protein
MKLALHPAKVRTARDCKALERCRSQKNKVYSPSPKLSSRRHRLLSRATSAGIRWIKLDPRNGSPETVAELVAYSWKCEIERWTQQPA